MFKDDLNLNIKKNIIHDNQQDILYKNYIFKVNMHIVNTLNASA